VVAAASSGFTFAQTAPFISAGIALSLGSAQLAFVRQQARRNDAALLKDLRSGWTEVRGSWRIVIASIVDVDDFYAPHLSAEDRSILERLGQAIMDDNWVDDRSDIKWLDAHIADVRMYLTQLAELVVSGRVSVDVAYSVVGFDLVPHNRPLRVLVGAAESSGLTGRQIWWHFNTLDAKLAGHRRLVVALGDLLWAEAIRRGDLSPHHVRTVAEHKRTSTSGSLARFRLKTLARRLGNSRRSTRRLLKLLAIAENPQKLPLYKELDENRYIMDREWPTLKPGWSSPDPVQLLPPEPVDSPDAETPPVEQLDH
jgi:hypothetical protein